MINCLGKILNITKMHYIILFLTLLLYCNAFLNSVDDNGQTLFMFGLIHHDKVDMYNYLLENDVYIDAKDNDGKSTLWYSIKYNRINAFKLLLASGIVIDKESEKILLNNQDYLEVIDNLDKSVFDIIESCDDDLLDNYLDYTKITPNIRDENGCPLIFHTIKKCTGGMIYTLHKYGANLQIDIPYHCTQDNNLLL